MQVAKDGWTSWCGVAMFAPLPGMGKGEGVA